MIMITLRLRHGSSCRPGVMFTEVTEFHVLCRNMTEVSDALDSEAPT